MLDVIDGTIPRVLAAIDKVEECISRVDESASGVEAVIGSMGNIL